MPQRAPVELGSRLLAGAVKGTLFTASAPAPQRPPRRTPWRPRAAFLLTAANAVLCLGIGVVDLARPVGSRVGAPALA